MKFWETLASELKHHHRVILLYVLESSGSSPGRQGFKMWVSDSESLYGSIGGGIMEHKLVEWCKKDLLQTDFKPFIKRQIHQNNIKKDKSGMICSGEQTVGFCLLQEGNLPVIQQLINGVGGNCLSLSSEGLSVVEITNIEDQFQFHLQNPDEWCLIEQLEFKPQLHIIGGGHVGLALSKLSHQLGFVVSVYDDREGLNTVEANHKASFYKIPDYQLIDQYIPKGKYQYVVLMSFGYRTDKTILTQLLQQEYHYLGMMGSKHKVAVLFEELRAEGFSQELIDQVRAPIGLPIHSKTPEEIAISILAELIQVKNGENIY